MVARKHVDKIFRKPYDSFCYPHLIVDALEGAKQKGLCESSEMTIVTEYELNLSSDRVYGVVVALSVTVLIQLC